MPFECESLAIPDVKRIRPKVFQDERGYFLETYKRSDWEKLGFALDFSQDNESLSRKGVLRGLHYQLPPYEQGKLIRVITGKIFDVAVDIRLDSPTYGQWVGEVLSGENKHMLWVPPGFAHGFLVLEDETRMAYKCTGEYRPDMERSILWSDPVIGIEWPLGTFDITPILSEKDRNASTFSGVLK